MTDGAALPPASTGDCDNDAARSRYNYPVTATDEQFIETLRLQAASLEDSSFESLIDTLIATRPMITIMVGGLRSRIKWLTYYDAGGEWRRVAPRRIQSWLRQTVAAPLKVPLRWYTAAAAEIQDRTIVAPPKFWTVRAAIKALGNIDVVSATRMRELGLER